MHQNTTMRNKTSWWGAALTAMLVCAVGAGFSFPAPAQESEEESEEPEEGMVELDYELPDPSYSGSPLQYTSERLEPLSWEDRDPIHVPEGVENVARDKPVSASADPRFNELEDIVNGEKAYDPDQVVELPEEPQWIQIDLEDEHEIYAILFWQFFESERVYFDVVVQVSNDPEFEEDVTTLFNNDYADNLGFGEGEDPEFITTHQGRLVEADGVEARYVRLWSNGNNWNDRNHWIEVEVYGKPS
ncbi:MAG: discoidin domain-containing protein [Candidatus Hydrogenedentota bacterium]